MMYPEEKYAQAIGWGGTALITGAAALGAYTLISWGSQSTQQSKLGLAQENIATLQRGQETAPSDTFVTPQASVDGVYHMQTSSYKKLIAEQQEIVNANQGPTKISSSEYGMAAALTLCAFGICMCIKKMAQTPIYHAGHALARKFSPKAYGSAIRPGD